MRQPSAVIHLTDSEIQKLQGWTRRGKTEYRLVERATMILLANEGNTNQQIPEAFATGTARHSK